MSIFHKFSFYLKLEIALKIPTSNESEMEPNNSAG